MKIQLDLDEMEADALADYCHKISFFDMINKASSTKQAHCINDALTKLEFQLLTKKATL